MKTALKYTAIVAVVLIAGIAAFFMSRAFKATPSPESVLASEIATYPARIRDAQNSYDARVSNTKNIEEKLKAARAEQEQAWNVLNGLKRAQCEKTGKLNSLSGISPIACPESFPAAGK